MMWSKRSATSVVRARSPDRVAVWLSCIQATRSVSSSRGQPSHEDWDRTAYGTPMPPIVFTVASRGSASTIATACARQVGSCAATRSGVR